MTETDNSAEDERPDENTGKTKSENEWKSNKKASKPEQWQ